MDLVNKATNFLACGVTGCAIPTNIPGMSRFEDDETGLTIAIVIILVFLIVLTVLLLIAVYR